jgi:hypothetical protein
MEPPLFARILERLLYGSPTLPDAPEGSVQYFHEEVESVMAFLFRRISFLSGFSLPSIGAAFAMHLVAIFSKCVADGLMTSAQAQHIVLQIARLEFDTEVIAQALRDAEKNAS